MPSRADKYLNYLVILCMYYVFILSTYKIVAWPMAIHHIRLVALAAEQISRRKSDGTRENLSVSQKPTDYIKYNLYHEF